MKPNKFTMSLDQQNKGDWHLKLYNLAIHIIYIVYNYIHGGREGVVAPRRDQWFSYGGGLPRFPNYTRALRPDHFQIFDAKTCNLNHNTKVPLNWTEMKICIIHYNRVAPNSCKCHCMGYSATREELYNQTQTNTSLTYTLK